VLKMPVPAEERKGLAGKLFVASERVLNKIDDTYRAIVHKALGHRPMVIGAAAALTIAAFLILPSIPSELVPVTDEGEVTVSARLASGTRVERTEQIAQRMEEMIRASVPELIDRGAL